MLTAMQIDKNIYAMPTKQKYKNYTFCYIFIGNDFNWNVEYSHGHYIENNVLHRMKMIEDIVEMDNDAVRDLHSLNHWKDIENNFTEFLKKD
jgi:hypothetical protein